jgi:predicted O-methyltransferase YrrM
LDVYADLQHALPLLNNGGVMIMDDFRSHKGVFHAVLRFAFEADLSLRENGPFAIFTPR